MPGFTCCHRLCTRTKCQTPAMHHHQKGLTLPCRPEGRNATACPLPPHYLVDSQSQGHEAHTQPAVCKGTQFSSPPPPPHHPLTLLSAIQQPFRAKPNSSSNLPCSFFRIRQLCHFDSVNLNRLLKWHVLPFEDLSLAWVTALVLL